MAMQNLQKNRQNVEFKTVILRLLQDACAAIEDQPAVLVHEESQPVSDIEIESYILATFPYTLTFSGENMQIS